MKAPLTRKQTLLVLTFIAVIFLGFFAFAAFQAKNDLYVVSGGKFRLTVWQAYVTVVWPIVVAAAYILTPLGLVLLVASKSRKRLFEYGLLSLGSGVICTLLIWLL